MRSLLIACALAAFSTIGADKPGSAKITGAVIAPKSVKNFSGLTLELRLYEYHPLIADKPADLIAKLEMKNHAHKKGKETKTTFTLADKRQINPRMSYYLTCFVIDANGKRYLMGEKDGKRGLCKMLTEGNPNKVKLILRDLRRQQKRAACLAPWAWLKYRPCSLAPSTPMRYWKKPRANPACPILAGTTFTSRWKS